jgi:lipopolysaccharide transport system ATP-binding protein
MSEVAMRVEGISKQYHIGQERHRYRTLRDTIAAAAAAPFRTLRSAFRHATDEDRPSDGTIWAVKDISFEVKRGEVIGVVGRNGAGKSTLLKILSRITEPSAGYADIHGRVGSLLEVGTGFHQELSGRENIFLNGAILGMKRAEIERRFDEMVAFAEVQKFIDTPVKHYSSGMYLRLAFAVAAHLEPEILLVDEVLAVGDVAFQKKCLGKMEDVASHGRTVLFVSHNMGAVKELCKTTFVLNRGELEFSGPVVEGLAHYSRSISEDHGKNTETGSGWRSIRVEGHCDEGSVRIESGQPFSIEALLDLDDDFAWGQLFCILTDAVGEQVIHQRIHSEELWSGQARAGRYRLRVELPVLWLAPGVYTVYFKLICAGESGMETRHLSDREIVDIVGPARGRGRASLAPPLRWNVVSGPGASAAAELVRTKL